jgi:hypothetical protein
MKKISMIILSTLSVLLLSGCGESSYEKPPFFIGNELLMVCKRPYYASSDCKNLYVRNNNGKSMTISPDLEDSIRLDNIYCTETTYNESICQGIDDKGATWDILKTSSRI